MRSGRTSMTRWLKPNRLPPSGLLMQERRGARPKSPTDLRRLAVRGGPRAPGGSSPASPPAFLGHERPSALPAVLVGSAGSGPPGSPNLSPAFPTTPLAPPVRRLQTRLQPVDQCSHLLPVSLLSGGDQVP